MERDPLANSGEGGIRIIRVAVCLPGEQSIGEEPLCAERIAAAGYRGAFA